MARHLLVLSLASFVLGCGGPPPAAPETPVARDEPVAWDVAVARLAGEAFPPERGAEPLRVVVMPFQAQDGARCDAGTPLVDELSDAVVRSRNGRVASVIERRALAQIQQEQQFSNSDLADPKTAVRLGKMSGATAIVLGSVSSAPGSYSLRVRVVSVETGAVLSAAGVRLRVDEVDARGGCGTPPPDVAGRITTADRVYGRQTVPHKIALYSSVTALVSGAVFGAIALAESATAEKHCGDTKLCDRTGADAVKVGRTAALVADASLGVALVALGIHFLIPPAEPQTAGVSLFPREGGIIGGRF